MANKSLFSSPDASGSLTVNEAGGRAYGFDDKHGLAQLAATGCLNTTFYASAEQQLDRVAELARRVAAEDPAFVARAALYARQRGYMKDMPALLLAVLAADKRDAARKALAQAFRVVVDNGKMLRNFAQIVRSGKLGRKSFGTSVKRLIQKWLNDREAVALFRDSVGNDPSLADVIKMAHPKPSSKERKALYGYLIGKPVAAPGYLQDLGGEPKIGFETLPARVQEFELWKREVATGKAPATVPNVPFQMLTAQPLPTAVWCEIAKTGGWHMLRMNLNTFARHGVFDVPGMTELVAEKLRDPKAVARARVFPYQLLIAYAMTRGDGKVPGLVRNALQEALEHSLSNVPSIAGKVYVAVDISGSMNCPVTGQREGATTRVTCADVAALIGAAVLRANPEATVLPFHTQVVPVDLNPRDSLATNAAKIASLPGGGTDCSAPLREILRRGGPVGAVIMASDNQSWAGMSSGSFGYDTGMSEAWDEIRRQNPAARIVLIDLAPYTSTQVENRPDVLNVGGFSDAVWTIAGEFLAGRAGGDYWVRAIEELVVE